MAERRYRVSLGERVVEVGVEDLADGRLLTVDRARLNARLLPVGPDGGRHLIIDGRSFELLASRNGPRIILAIEGVALEVLVEDELAVRLAAFGGGQARTGGAQRVVAPMPGLVVRVNAATGQAVTAGESLVVLQAMKMENELGSPRGGTVRSVAVEAGQAVEQGQLLVELE
jgi:acetyl/propionyl-CoA carboxylase alpha subunit